MMENWKYTMLEAVGLLKYTITASASRPRGISDLEPSERKSVTTELTCSAIQNKII
jgi:hypothetical protein